MVGSGCDLILRYNPGIHLEGLRKTMKNLNQVSRSWGRDLNTDPPEYDSGVLTTRPQCSVAAVQNPTSSCWSVPCPHHHSSCHPTPVLANTRIFVRICHVGALSQTWIKQGKNTCAHTYCIQLVIIFMCVCI
jgi:hypothetical protein